MAQYVRTNYTNYDNTVCYNNILPEHENITGQFAV